MTVTARYAIIRPTDNTRTLRVRVYLLASVGFVAALVGGCAAPGGDNAPVAFTPMRFPAEGEGPFVLVRGNLDTFLSEFDATPALDAFLYGPNDYGQTPLRNPQGMALDGLRLLVCDQGQPDVVGVDLDTGRCLLWCNYDDRPRCPVDVATCDDGTVLVADTSAGRVLHFDARGRLMRDLAPSRPEHKPFRPCGLAFRGPTLCIADLTERRIERLDLSSNRWLDPLASPESNRPLIAPTGLAVTPDGVLLIADAIAGCVHRLDSNDRWLAPIGRPGRGPGELVRPKQVCGAPSGAMLVTDAGRQSVVVYDVEGALVTEVHARDKNWSGWTLPMGIEILPIETATAMGIEPMSQATDTFLIVSDSLGGQSLTLLELIVPQATEDNDGVAAR